MKTRAETVEFLKDNDAWERKYDLSGKTHFGLFELRELMDFIYDGKPVNDTECIDLTHLD